MKVFSSVFAVVAIFLVMCSTLLHTSFLFLMALLKWLLPFQAIRNGLSIFLIKIAESWVAFNSWLIDIVTPTKFIVTGVETLKYEGWYLVISNHQSWVDIPILQKLFNRRIPFLKFFLKGELIWVPFLGLAWWALDFPFMQRYTKTKLKQNPHLKGKDIEATRKACEHFKFHPVSVMNFVEGTRFTPIKHDRQNSPFNDLLKVKAGGIAFVLDAMRDSMKSIVDVTIVYSDGRPTLMDLFSGRIRQVHVDIVEREITPDLIGDYANDNAFRIRFHGWLNGVWQEKQKTIERLKSSDS
jgi:1-acyl-sn-glycerol-3-phosphate acyltransferase